MTAGYHSLSTRASQKVTKCCVVPLTALDPCIRSAGNTDRAKIRELNMLSQQAQEAFVCLERGFKAADGKGRVRQGMKNVSISIKACEQQQ